jgi:hypothetical protein
MMNAFDRRLPEDGKCIAIITGDGRRIILDMALPLDASAAL